MTDENDNAQSCVDEMSMSSSKAYIVRAMAGNESPDPRSALQLCLEDASLMFRDKPTLPADPRDERKL